MKFEYIFFGLFFSFIAYFGYSMIRHGGLRGALFGAKVLHTVGEVSSSKRGLMSQKLKVVAGSGVMSLTTHRAEERSMIRNWKS